MKSYLAKILEKQGQSHLLLDFEKLTETEKKSFSEAICALDFDIFERAKHFEEKRYASLTPMPIFYAEQAEKEKDELEKLGLCAIAEGKVGAVLLCGGQGTRLG